jgi:hypothetical protein
MYDKEYSYTFSGIPELRGYFHQFPPIAELLGYVANKNRKSTGTHQENATKATLYIEYSDRVVKEAKHGFDNVEQFVSYLEDQPLVANWLGYVNKRD